MSEPVSNPSRRNHRLTRRRAPKARVRATCRRGELDMGPNLALSLVDLSETGVRLVVKEPLEPGHAVSIGLEGQSYPRPVMRVGTVMSSTPADGGVYTVGVLFQKRLAYQDFLELTCEYTLGG